MRPLPPTSTLFPYTTLFRSRRRSSLRRSAAPPAPQGTAERTPRARWRSEEHTSELQSLTNLVCRLLLEKKKKYHEYLCTNVKYYMSEGLETGLHDLALAKQL